MDQSVLAGVGNVYRSEVLFRHRLSPFTEGRDFRKASWRLVWDDLVRLLPLGVATGRIVTVAEQVEDVEAALGRGEVPHVLERSSYVYKRDGLPCRVCGSRIRTRVVAGRNLFWCGRCQRRRWSRTGSAQPSTGSAQGEPAEPTTRAGRPWSAQSSRAPRKSPWGRSRVLGRGLSAEGERRPRTGTPRPAPALDPRSTRHRGAGSRHGPRDLRWRD